MEEASKLQRHAKVESQHPRSASGNLTPPPHHLRDVPTKSHRTHGLLATGGHGPNTVKVNQLLEMHCKSSIACGKRKLKWGGPLSKRDGAVPVTLVLEWALQNGQGIRQGGSTC